MKEKDRESKEIGAYRKEELSFGEVGIIVGPKSQSRTGFLPKGKGKERE